MRGKECTKWNEMEKKLIKTEIRKTRLTSLRNSCVIPIYLSTRKGIRFGLRKAGDGGIL